MPHDVPEGWSVQALGDVATVLLSNVDKKTVAGEPVVRLCNYMDVYTNASITNDVAFMHATATKEQVAKFGLRRGDVMITKDSEDPADIGIPSVVAEELSGPVLCGYHLALLRPLTIDGPYLAWALRSRPVNEQFVRRANGSTRFGLTSSVIGTARVPVPPLPEQKKIAAILSYVDEAIQATQLVIDQTRRVKEGLLQDLLTRGLPGHTRFKQTEIGEIPESWELGRIGDIVEVVDPQPDHRTPPAVVDGVPYIGIGDIDADGKYDLDRARRVSPVVLTEQRGRYTLGPSSFVFGKIGTIGRPAVVPAGDLCLSANLVLVTGPSATSNQFAFHALQSRFVKTQIWRQTNTTSQPALGIEKVRMLRIAIPPMVERAAIVDRLDVADVAVAKAREQLAVTLGVKSGLLQDLLTGKVRVSP